MAGFDELFDFDKNGDLDTLEKASRASFLDQISVIDRIEDDVFYDEEIDVEDEE